MSNQAGDMGRHWETNWLRPDVRVSEWVPPGTMIWVNPNLNSALSSLGMETTIPDDHPSRSWRVGMDLSHALLSTTYLPFSMIAMIAEEPTGWDRLFEEIEDMRLALQLRIAGYALEAHYRAEPPWGRRYQSYRTCPAPAPETNP